MIISHQIGCREIHAPLEHRVESVLQNGFLLIYVPDLQKQNNTHLNITKTFDCIQYYEVYYAL